MDDMAQEGLLASESFNGLTSCWGVEDFTGLGRQDSMMLLGLQYSPVHVGNRLSVISQREGIRRLAIDIIRPCRQRFGPAEIL
jgi:hypothetical protein